MPSVQKTPNLGLNKWQGNEYAKRADFVDDNEKIDKAVGNLASAINDFSKKSKIVVTEDPGIERQEGCFYFFITDKQSQNIVDNLKVSPSMGLKIEE